MAYEAYLTLLLLAMLIAFALLLKAFLSLRKTVAELRSARAGDSVRHGKAWEQFVPFMRSYPFDPQNFRFLGSPIDGISFEEDRIVFIEIKTGASRLSAKQQKVRQQVDEGKVEFMAISG
ncbi:hypothetical protein JXB02_05610 [Candidatus Woesearchaeota archaeon]|nr:hypothetical protein [Candidatus Woesearchaeota archaeon]